MASPTSHQLQFPKDFIFGVADADLQTIGTKNTIEIEKSERTEWDSFTNGFHKDTPEIGIDRYHRWKEDAKLMATFGVKHYRTSVSMSRTLSAQGEVNMNAIQWYKNYFKLLRSLGIKIYVTLYHWELPEYLSHQGGWTNPRTSQAFIKHAEVVYQELGEYIEEYFILNEPWVIAMLGYYLGVNPPQEKSLAKALLVTHTLLMAQASVFERLSHLDPNLKISTVVNVESAYPQTDTEADEYASNIYDGYFNRWFLDPLFKGEYPKDMKEIYKKHMPLIGTGDMKYIQIGAKLHSLGINYYRGVTIEANTNHISEAWQDEKDLGFNRSTIVPGATVDGMGKALYIAPHYKPGLYDFLVNAYQTYRSYGLKSIYITENGLPLYTPWDGTSIIIDDQKRIDVLTKHLTMLDQAIKSGVPVNGYFHWTLMDNFEWGGGYDPNNSYGLVHIDRATLKRVPKKSLHWYKEVMSTHQVIQTTD